MTHQGTLTAMTGLTLFLDRLAEARTRDIAWRETVAHFGGHGFEGVLSLTCVPDADGRGTRRLLASVEAAVVAVCEDRAAALKDGALAHMAGALRPALLTTETCGTAAPDEAPPPLLLAAAGAGYGGLLLVPLRCGGVACAAGMILLSRHAPAVCRDLVDRHGLELVYAASQAQLRLGQLGVEEDGAAPALTNREREVLVLSAHGMTTREVAEALGISVSGVNFHIGNAARKLGANNRTHATSLAIAGGLIAV
ncbi:helix-turn-helix transcriptional regulator [Roseospira goensis]|uniref:DNA-binding CsgD family transcriptional regulator n=1 Tax=Roseospira goensis TaxID=391922 RepID=A0A7W6RY99_9PROT|nr:helix-turn-helix transcriptional regulator [Roseospira goensis]MBB4285470.1 DNA-binding CsgD family transcriptional regulator [Roseospira goensis]